MLCLKKSSECHGSLRLYTPQRKFTSLVCGIFDGMKNGAMERKKLRYACTTTTAFARKGQVQFIVKGE